MKPLIEVKKAYIAGIIDGEGTVTLTKQHKNETETPCVTVANNDLDLLKWIKSKVGGVIVNKKKRMFHHRNSYAWQIKQNRAISFLNEVKQYLIIKKQHADLITSRYKIVTHRAGKYSQQMLEKKKELVAEIRELNRR